MSFQSTSSQSSQSSPIGELTIDNSISVIIQSLNKACKLGSFTLDEAYIIKVHLANLQQFIDIKKGVSGPSSL